MERFMIKYELSNRVEVLAVGDNWLKAFMTKHYLTIKAVFNDINIFAIIHFPSEIHFYISTLILKALQNTSFLG